MSLFPSLNMIEDRVPHILLNRRAPAYNNLTLRRAFIVWLYCGQRNNFYDVCKYFQRLEAMEDELSPDRRAASRHLELQLYSRQPPTSPCQAHYFPTLYSYSHIDVRYLRKLDAIRREMSAENEDNLKVREGVTKHEIVEASLMIQQYCKAHQVPLAQFLKEFNEYAAKSEVEVTVNSVRFYIKRKIVHEDLRVTSSYREKYSLSNLAGVVQRQSPKNTSARENALNIEPCKGFGDFNDIQMKLLSGVTAKFSEPIVTSVIAHNRTPLK